MPNKIRTIEKALALFIGVSYFSLITIGIWAPLLGL